MTATCVAAASPPIDLALVVASVPAWLVSVARALAAEGVASIALAPRGRPESDAGTLRAGARLRASIALDAWIARRILGPAEDAWTPAALASRRRDGAPAIVLGLDAPPAPVPDGEAWWFVFGVSGTRYAEELARGDAVLGIELRARDASGAEVVLARSRTKAARSLHLSRSRAGWKAAGLLERALRRRASGALRTPAPAEPAELPRRAAAGLAARTVRRAFAVAAREDAWRIEWRARTDDALPDARGWRAEHALAAPRGSFHADPFLLEHAGRTALFFERWAPALGRGVLSAVELDARGAPGPARDVVRAEHHLSYPFVFEHEGRAWMIPETRAARRIELWRAHAFPFDWRFERTLMDGVDAVDATWFTHGGLHWLFACCAREHAPRSEELCAFWSERPFGPWNAHAANPIVDDPCGARPGGRPFVLGGRLVRPAQDSALEYGGRVLFREVRALDPERYEERALGVFDPECLAGVHGAHTYDRSARFEVVDLRATRWRRPAWTFRRAR